MAQISVNNLTFYYDGSFDNILENVSFSIDTNWKLGFIGRNGKGKTTFLNLLLGKYEYRGSISTNVIFDYFPYQISKECMEQPAIEFAADLKAGCEEWRIFCELFNFPISFLCFSFSARACQIIKTGLILVERQRICRAG